MQTRILRACAASAASCFVILGARSQTVTAPATAQPAAPVTVQPVTPPTPLLATTPAAPAPTPAPYSFSMQGVNSNGATWSLPSSGAFPALSMTGPQQASNVVESAPRPSKQIPAPRPPCYVSIVRRQDAASNDLKALMNNGWPFTLTVTIYGPSGQAVQAIAFTNSRVKSVTAIFDSQRQLDEQLNFQCESMSWLR
jgi:hypothetical protein